MGQKDNWCWRPLAIVLAAAAMLLVPVAGYAEQQLITASGEWTMGEGETMESAMQHALQAAQRSAVEQVGIYVESISKRNNMMITKDEVNTIAGGVIKITDKHFASQLLDLASIKYTATITAVVDDIDLPTLRKRLAATEGQKLIMDNVDNQSASNDSESRLKALQAKLAVTPSADDKKQLRAEIAKTERAFIAVTAKEWVQKGNFFWFTEKDLDSAEAAYKQALALDKNCAQAYAGLSGVYNNKQQFAAAFDNINVAIALEPGNYKLYGSRGFIYKNQGKYEEAIADFSYEIAHEKPDYYAYVLRAELYIKMKQYDAAEGDYEAAIRSLDASRPDYADVVKRCKHQLAFDVYLQHGQELVDQKYYDQAIAQYTEAIVTGNQYQDDFLYSYYYNRADAYGKQENYEKAIEDYRRSLALKPTANIYYYCGEANEKLGRFDEARDAYRACIASDSSEDRLYTQWASDRLKELG